MTSHARPFVWLGAFIFGGALTSCRMNRGAEVHIIPEGFVGPVVIVYGVPGGEEVGRDDNGTTVYRIPPSGKLFVKRPLPKPGWYRMTYVIEAGSGVRELTQGSPTEDDPKRLQILGRSSGVAPRDIGEVKFVTYFVGVPAQQPAWGERLERRMDQVIAEAATKMKSAGVVPSP